MLRPLDSEILYATLTRKLVRNCRTCGGSGKLTIPNPDDPDDPMRRIVRCSCLEEVASRCKLSEGNVPEEFWSVDRLIFEKNLQNLKRIDAYCDDIAGARETGRGFVFCGENGTGKTSMSVRILIAAMRAGFSIGYLTTQEFLTTIIPASNDRELGEWFRAVQGADFLVLDEIGKENRKDGADGSSFWLASLDSLIRQRCQSLRPTILVSNFAAHDVVRTYGDSFASMLAPRVEYLTFRPGDFRQERAKRRNMKPETELKAIK